MSWSSLASRLRNLESAPDEAGLAFPPLYLGTFLQLHACCSSTAGASWRGWNLGLRLCGEEPVDSPTLSQPVALSVFGLFRTPRERQGWAGGTAQGPWAPGLGSESIVQVWGWPRAGDKPLGTRAPGPRVRAGAWGEGSGCCSLYNNKPASARGLWRGCGVCLWAQPEGLAEGARDAAGPVFFLQFP